MIVYRIAPQWQVGLETLEDALQKATFAACGATQERAVGFVPPRGEAHGPLAESVGGQWILRFMVEAKVLPGSVLARKVQDKVDQIERETGRKPGKKEKRDLKDEAKLDLLPMAFTKMGSMWVWIPGADQAPGARHRQPGARRRGGEPIGGTAARRLCGGAAAHADLATDGHGALAQGAGPTRRLHGGP